MRVLLDTQVLLWAVLDSPRLGDQARQVISGADQVLVSAASVWEVAIKSSVGKLDLEPQQLLVAIAETGFTELPITADHAARTATLPWHHRDPFDRLLVAQALTEPLHLMTADRQLVPYSGLVMLV